MALNTVSSDRLSTNVKTSNLGTELKGKIGERKNLIINGAMQVAQRGTSSTANGYGSVDRFSVTYSGTDEAPTHAQADVASGTTPYTLGFRKSLKLTNGNQTSGAGATDGILIQHKLEGQDVTGSGWNYLSSSSNVTLSFWVKSSVAQNFYFALITQSGTQKNYPMETGSLSADTWTKITKTIPGGSGITINNDNALGLFFEFMLFRGTDKTGSVNLNEWGTYVGSARTPDQTSTWYTTNDATFEITGVQLELGSVATDFEHRSFAQKLALCQRYFQRVNGCLVGVGAGTTSIRANYQPIVNFRASPTITGNVGVSFVNPGVNAPTQSSFDCGIQHTYTPNNVGINLGFGNFSNANQGYTYLQWDADDEYVNFDAEL